MKSKDLIQGPKNFALAASAVVGKSQRMGSVSICSKGRWTHEVTAGRHAEGSLHDTNYRTSGQELIRRAVGEAV